MSLILSRQDVPGSGNNITSYVNPEIDALIDSARSVPGCAQEERAELYHEIQRIAHEDVAYVWLFAPNMFHVSNSRIGGLRAGRYLGLLRLPGSSARVGHRRVGALSKDPVK